VSWKRRLAELALAGGLVAAGGCDVTGPATYDAAAPYSCDNPPPGPGGLCNANPDPCCCAIDLGACNAYRKGDLSVAPRD